ncbi:Ca2+-transporting ATPase [Sporomusaceae bacterium BoRhaA]|uniref:cation-translocating P-type ATPase n=1 Tax=Pelorhabdus rhamnosifermentans TaxID=2772457 RepID=UPI0028B167C2|nr:cation-translocating P-type ATPase [Pelorhabdus rhamnosifermentans]MBU2700236.1 Ca2+-transporting ATPase [Pelorhabdus rhamnosifermentans]
MVKEKWYLRSADDVIDYFRSHGEEGLTTQEVRSRLSRHGYNEMAAAQRASRWQIFISQFQDFMVLVLLAATLISAFLGEYADSFTILVIVIVNAALGYFQEYRAEESIETLKKMVAPIALVIRNGMVQQVPARSLVPGDILVLEAGQKIAADARLIECQFLEADEAVLTGESLSVRKNCYPIAAENSSLGDQNNMTFSGTTVTRGRGKGVVCATGMDTEVGQIADLMSAIGHEETPLEKRLEQLGKKLVWSCLIICLLVVITGVMKGESLFLMCMAGISLAVAAIPEGLPAIVTVALALGVQRMIRRNAIIRKLPAVETLGCITAICSDKTGTLTQNVMTVREIYINGTSYETTGLGYEIQGEFLCNKQKVSLQAESILDRCLRVGVYCNNSVLKKNTVSIGGSWRKRTTEFSIEGDPTEGALIIAGAKAGIWRNDLEKQAKRICEIPFEPERRRMSVLYEESPQEWTLYTKGAVDTILDLCRYQESATGPALFSDDDKQSILAANAQLTDKALRVLALAYRKISALPVVQSETENLECDLVFVGLMGMIDPPREAAKQSIMVCRQAGIKTIMITGDHPNTAVAIAQELSMYQAGKSRVLTGAELDALNDREFKKIVNDVVVYARVSPSHKLRIVRALKQRGHIVAMTGDGVNDAPAIKEADIGIAMGKTGTDVAKEASAMILTDDDFATIVAAVEEGRGIYDNIRKFIRYLLACNMGEVLTMFAAALLGVPLPLLPVQILWVNLVTDGLPAMALGVDGHDRNIMFRPPRFPGESVFSRGLSHKIMARGFQIGFSTLGVFAYVYFIKDDLVLARTMAFTTLVFCQLFHVFDCRSEVASIMDVGFFTNKYLIGAVSCSVLMQLAVLYIPVLRNVFATVPLLPTDWALVLIVSGWTFLLTILKKILWRRTASRSVFSRT